jgi:hypothetical protein
VKYARPHKIPKRNANCHLVLGMGDNRERAHHHPFLFVLCGESTEYKEKKEEGKHDPSDCIFDICLLQYQPDELFVRTD